MSVADKLTAIAENEQRVYEAGQRAVLRASRYMNGMASGAAVALSDVSSVEHEVTVKVKSRNLLPYPYPQSTRTAGGITFTDNGDGSITMNGTATSIVIFCLHGNGTGTNATLLSDAFLDGTAYCVSSGAALPDGVSIGNYFYKTDGTLSGGAHISSGKSHNDFSKTEERARLYLHIRVDNGTVLDDFTIYPMIEKGTTASPYVPYALTLSEETVTVNGETYTAAADGTVNGVKRVAPCMTFTSETGNVTIECSYLRDIDTYIDGITEGGV